MNMIEGPDPPIDFREGKNWRIQCKYRPPVPALLCASAHKKTLSGR